MATIFTPNQATLVNNAAVFRGGIINRHQRKAITVYLKTRELKQNGGTDYTANYPGLFAAAIQATAGIDPDAMEAAYLNLELVKANNQSVDVYNNGGVSGAASSNVSTLLIAAATILPQPDDILDRVILYLEGAIWAKMFNS